jgi:hypothetical protein
MRGGKRNLTEASVEECSAEGSRRGKEAHPSASPIANALTIMTCTHKQTRAQNHTVGCAALWHVDGGGSGRSAGSGPGGGEDGGGRGGGAHHEHLEDLPELAVALAYELARVPERQAKGRKERKLARAKANAGDLAPLERALEGARQVAVEEAQHLVLRAEGRHSAHVAHRLARHLEHSRGGERKGA